MPVAIGNDANIAALGEQRYGAGKDVQDLVFLTISTGIGAGIIIDGRLFTGAAGYAGEVGHMTVDAHGPYGASTTPGAWGVPSAPAQRWRVSRRSASPRASAPPWPPRCTTPTRKG